MQHSRHVEHIAKVGTGGGENSFHGVKVRLLQRLPPRAPTSPCEQSAETADALFRYCCKR